MRIEDVMTTPVVSVERTTPLKEVARLLVANRISGVPVCDDEGAVVGVVSEADILLQEEGFESEPGGPLAWLGHEHVLERAARTAGEAMTAPPVTVEPTMPVAYAAKLMTERGVNRLPVVRGHELVGIVSRADLVRAFIRTDAEIEHDILEDVLLRTLWVDPGRLDVTVEDGRAILAGEAETRTEAELVEAYVRRVPGVVEVDASELGYAVDDLARRTRTARLPRRV